jgi:phage terminase large subunit-like protein
VIDAATIDLASLKRVPGKYERLWRERHERDLALASQPGGHPKGFTFDAEAGERVVRFIEDYCVHTEAEWAGQPFILADWQREMLASLFGWFRADGTRRFRKAWIEIPRKNGKSILASGLALYLLVADGEPGAQVYATATKEDQAKIVWGNAARMVKLSKKLSRYLKAYRKSIFCERLGANFRPLGGDSSTLDGLSPHGDLRDEVHAWKDEHLSAVLDTAMGSRRQPVTIEITTAGVYDPESVGWKHHNHAVKVLEGAIEDDAFFAFIAAADENADVFDPATWFQANPNLGTTPKLSYIAEQAERARLNPSDYNAFLQLHLNRWTAQVVRWLSIERWNESDKGDLDYEALRKLPAYGGLDLSTKIDLSAFVLAFPHDDGSISLVARFWVPEERVKEQLQKGSTLYDAWVKQGFLTATPGDTVDYDLIGQEILALSERFSIQEIAYDPWGATQFALQLADEGFQMVECRQGYKTLSEPSKDFQAKILGRKVRTGGNPLMRWMVSNACISKDPAGNIKPDKEKAVDKIDGVVASIMALSRLNLNAVETERPTCYAL